MAGSGHYAEQLHYFNDMTVVTELQPDGEYSAIDADNFDLGWPVGYGKSRYQAIIDLAEQMRERGWLKDEINE